MTYLNPYSIKTTMGFVKSKKPIQSDSFFLAFEKEETFSSVLLVKKKKKKLNLTNQTEATQNRQIKLNLRNP
jgi:hypothetical protein